jgi:hypothetical protein
MQIASFALIVVCAMLLGGCSLFSFSPSLELMKATGQAASFMVAGIPTRASDTVRHDIGQVGCVCIAFNPSVSLEDFLPAIQTSLQRQQVDSRVFESGALTPLCPVWLYYAASIEWGVPPWASSLRPYVAHATLTLKTPDGRVLASSNYEPGGVMGMGQWASTRDKVDAVVTALVGPTGG